MLPFRQSLIADDAPGIVRSDTVTLISVPATVAQTTLAADLLPGALTLAGIAGARLRRRHQPVRVLARHDDRHLRRHR